MPGYQHIKIRQQSNIGSMTCHLASPQIRTLVLERAGLRACMVALAVLLNLTGCTNQPSDAESEHLEHVIPAHKPATFAAAVEQIQSRHERIKSSFTTAEPAVLEKELTELQDILGWLTELAADSALKKGSWDEVNAISREILAIYQTIAQESRQTPRSELPGNSKRIDECLPLLNRLIPQSVDTL